MKEIIVLRFRKIGDLNVATKQSSRDLFRGNLNKDQTKQIGNEIFNNFLIGKFEVGERFISYGVVDKDSNLTLGTIALIEPEFNKFAVTSEVDGTVTYFVYREALGVIDNNMNVSVISTPDNWLDDL